MKKIVSNALWGLYIGAALTVAGICGAAAYIDPSVVSFAASAIGGILIAAGAVLFVWWRKVKKKVSDKLGIDEDANKEKEEDIVINADGDSAVIGGETAADGAEQTVPADENR
jgi:hypothetical protein